MQLTPWLRPFACIAILLASTLAAAETASAETPRAATASAETPRIGLVLGGGGARGAAHIGVLQVLERERIPIHMMAGTSVGAIVGGLYATGYSADEIAVILAGIDWADALRDQPPRLLQPIRRKDADLRQLLDTRIGFSDGKVLFPQGFIQGQRLLQLLRRLFMPAWEVDRFDDLVIPFRCVGTDIGRGEGVVFDGGDLALAVRASMSVPGAFAPIRVNDRLMVDGGLINNLPADVAREMGATRLIVVEVSAPLAAESALTSPLSVSLQMVDMLINRRTDEALAALAADDIVIKPDLGAITSASFDQTVSAIEAGRLAAEAALPQLRALALDEEAWAAHVAARPTLSFDPGLIEFLQVMDTQTRSAGFVEKRLAKLAGSALDIAEVDAAVNAVYGSGGFETVDWRLARDGDRTGIVVNPVDKGWGPNYLSVGLRLSDDFAGRSAYQLVFETLSTGMNRAGAEWRNTLSMGEYAGLRSEWFQPLGALSDFYVQPHIDYRAYGLPLRGSNAVLSDFRLTRTRIGVDVGWDLSPIERISASLLRGRSKLDKQGGEFGFDANLQGNFGALQAGYVRDTLDSVKFPTSGSRFESSALLFRPTLGSENSGEILRLSYDRAWNQDRHNWLLGARGQVAYGQPDVVAGLAELGGFLNVSGYSERELLGVNSLLLRGVYYRRLGDQGSLFSLPAYVGGSLEAGNAGLLRSDLGLDELRGAASIFLGVDSPLGPVFVGYGLSERGVDSFYLHFGSLLRPAVP